VASPTADWLELPQDVELAVRGKVFLLNYSETEQSITLHRKAVDLLSGQIVNGTAKIAPYGVMILDLQES
jgi:beta-galactosidase GanA